MSLPSTPIKGEITKFSTFRITQQYNRRFHIEFSAPYCCESFPLEALNFLRTIKAVEDTLCLYQYLVSFVVKCAAETLQID